MTKTGGRVWWIKRDEAVKSVHSVVNRQAYLLSSILHLQRCSPTSILLRPASSVWARAHVSTSAHHCPRTHRLSRCIPYHPPSFIRAAPANIPLKCSASYNPCRHPPTSTLPLSLPKLMSCNHVVSRSHRWRVCLLCWSVVP